MSTATIHPTQTVLTYCCFTDRANIGDYALYRANQRLFPHARISGDQADTESSVNLFGGGSMYPYSLRLGLFRRRRTNVAIGIGVHDPGEGKRYGLLTRLEMLRWRFLRFGVRGYRSQQICARHGIRAEVTGDTALVFERTRARKPVQGLVAVSIVGETMERLGSPRQVYTEVRSLCKQLLAEGLRICLVPFCIRDLDTMSRLRSELPQGVEFVNFWNRPTEDDLELLLDYLQDVDLMVGERLHSVVLAAALGVPFVSIGYKQKCYDFVECLGLERYMQHPDELQAEPLAARALDVLRQKQGVAALVAERAATFRNRLRAFADDIAEAVEAV